jgi:hypothetical protein
MPRSEDLKPFLFLHREEARNDEAFPFYEKYAPTKKDKLCVNHLKGSAMEKLSPQVQTQTSVEQRMELTNRFNTEYTDSLELDLKFILTMLPKSDATCYVGHEYFIG